MNGFIGGNLGLAKTYWLFGVLGTLIMKLILTLLVLSGVNPTLSIIIAIAYSAVVWIAVWNSASQYQGLKLWAILAKVSVVFGILASLAEFNK